MFQNPIVTVDVVLLTLKEGELHVLLLKRENEPFVGARALPGGFVHSQEDADIYAAAVRVLGSKLGLSSPYLEQLEVFSGPHRDPRGWSISCAHFALVGLEVLQPVLDANPNAELIPVDSRKASSGLIFDHDKIVQAAVRRVRTKGQYSSLPCLLAGDSFTLSKLQAVYAAVLSDKTLYKANFRKWLEKMEILEQVPGQKYADGPHRPAQVYRLKPAYRNRLHLMERGL